MSDPVGLVVAVVICLPALLLVSQRSTWIVDYLFFVLAFNRCIRRIVDYNNGYFNPYSLVSLTPLVVCGLATLAVLIELNRRRDSFGNRTAAVLFLYLIAIGMAFFIGFINSRFAAVYALGDYLAPIGLIGCGALFASDDRVIDRWCQSVTLTALLVAIYGIWQFYTIPPWDGFWLIASGMDGYMGTPEPQKMTLFSTMNERGPAGSYMCGGLTLLLLRQGTLGWIRWPAVGILAIAILLTYSRTAVIQIGSAVLLYPLLNRGTRSLSSIFIVILIAICGPQLISQLPGFERASDRVATLGNIHEDGSFQGRLMLFGVAIRESVTEPLGIGIGSHGLAAKVSTANKEGTADSTGYIKTLRTFGWIGFMLITVMMWRIWVAARDLAAIDPLDKNAMLFRAWYVSGMIAFLSGDWLFTATFFWVLAGYCLGRANELQENQWRSFDDFQEVDDYCDEELSVET